VILSWGVRAIAVPVSLGLSVSAVSCGWAGQGWCLVAPGDSLHA